MSSTVKPSEFCFAILIAEANANPSIGSGVNGSSPVTLSLRCGFAMRCTNSMHHVNEVILSPLP